MSTVMHSTQRPKVVARMMSAPHPWHAISGRSPESWQPSDLQAAKSHQCMSCGQTNIVRAIEGAASTLVDRPAALYRSYAYFRVGIAELSRKSGTDAIAAAA
jgi:hypothetical protein